MVQVIRIVPHLAAAFIHHFHGQGTCFEYLLYVTFSGERDHGTILAYLCVVESIQVRVGCAEPTAISRSAGDLLELDIHIYLPVDDPLAIFAAEKAVVDALVIVAPYFRKREPLIIDLDASSGQDASVPGYLPAIHLCAVIFYEAIIRGLFHLVAIIECPIVDLIDP